MSVTQATVMSDISSKFSALTEKQYSLGSRMESMDDGRTPSYDGNYHRSHDDPKRGIDCGGVRQGVATEVGAEPS